MGRPSYLHDILHTKNDNSVIIFEIYYLFHRPLFSTSAISLIASPDLFLKEALDF